MEVSILIVFFTAVSLILLFPMTFHDFLAIANIYAPIAIFLGLHWVLSTAKFTIFGHGLHVFGESPTFPKIRTNTYATFVEFVGVVNFVHGQIHAIWSWFVRVWGEPRISQDTCKHRRNIRRICRRVDFFHGQIHAIWSYQLIIYALFHAKASH